MSLRSARGQRGFSAIMAVVLIVIFALIGTYMATITATQSLSATVSLSGSQATFAARSAMEWAIHAIVTAGAHPVAALSCDNPADPTLSVSGGGGGNFSVDIVCAFAPSPYTEGSKSVNVYRLTATASRGTPGEVDYVSRKLSASVTAD